MNTVSSKEAVPIPREAFNQRSGSPPITCERLDSWKEIAAHLRRSVRCVQRWERTAGLPVLRHQHEKGATVYAYPHELDQWWEQGRSDVSRAGRFLPTQGTKPDMLIPSITE
jgi:hypothetical protein